jgi:hypothetical protein
LKDEIKKKINLKTGHNKTNQVFLA